MNSSNKGIIMLICIIVLLLITIIVLLGVSFTKKENIEAKANEVNETKNVNIIGGIVKNEIEEEENLTILLNKGEIATETIKELDTDLILINMKLKMNLK